MRDATRRLRLVSRALSSGSDTPPGPPDGAARSTPHLSVVPPASPFAPLPLPEDDETVEALRVWVKQHFGIDFARAQLPIFAARISAVSVDTGRGAEALLAAARAGDRAVIGRLAEAVSTNHTYFMREAEVLEVVARDILPTLGRAPRLWSAAASSGDEAYTLAMLARERLPAEATPSILGTDLSARHVRLAEQGIYPSHQLALLSQERLGRWFRPVGLGQHEVVGELKALCTFRRMNLTQAPWPFERGFEVVFLRNVLFYFDQATRQRVLEAAWDATEPGGWLVTSLTEPMLDVVTRWAPVRPAIYRKVA